MTKYLIKEVSIGTPNNPNFAGVKKVIYMGKGHFTNIGRSVFEDDYEDKIRMEFPLKWLAMQYGYESEASAKRGITAAKKHTDEESAKYGHHTFEYTLHAVEC